MDLKVYEKVLVDQTNYEFLVNNTKTMRPYNFCPGYAIFEITCENLEALKKKHMMQLKVPLQLYGYFD